MKQRFNAAEIDQDKPGIVLMSHGPMACSVLESAEVILGSQIQNSAAFCLESEDDPTEFGNAAEEGIRSFPKGCIILLDILGGTPFNQIMRRFGREENIPYILTGVNLPMLISAFAARESESPDIMEEMLRESSDGIVNVTEKIEEMRKEK